MASSKSTKSPAFQFYPSDFLGDDRVARMTYTEIGIYTVLLSRAWLAGGLPTDVGEIAKMLKLPPPRFRKLWAGVLSECFTVKNGRLVNPRQEKERQKQADYRRRQSDKANTRWQASGNATALPAHKPRQSRRNALQSSSSTSSTQIPTGSESPQPHPVRDFLALYVELFKARFGVDPVIAKGRDAKIASDVLKRGQSEAYRLLRAFFDSPDPFIQDSGYGLNIFAGQINKLLVGARSVRPVPGDRTVNNEAELRAFIDRRPA